MANEFGTIDIIVFAITLVISMMIGVFFAWKGQNSTTEYLMGGRDMPLIPTALSILVSFYSGVLILGLSSEMYMKGTDIFWYLPGLLLGVMLTIIIYVPIFYKLKMTSVYEYLYIRFQSRTIRLMGSVYFIINTLLYMGIVLYAPSTALAGVTNVNENVLIAITGLTCTIYTMLGGLKAVVWTDAFQAVVMYGGLLAIVIQGLLSVGGISNAWKIAVDGGRITTNWSANPFVYMNFWTVFFGTAFGWMAIYGTNQSSVQRYCSMSTLKRAKWSLILVLPGAILMVPLVYACGLVMYSYYAHCDPLLSREVGNRDQLIPYFTIEILGHLHGLPGIFVSALFSGTLSTVSSGLNSLAAVTWEDFLRVEMRKRIKIDETKATKITKGLVLVYGIVAIAFSYVAQFLGGVLQAAMTMLNAIGGPVAGVFLFGIMFPWGNAKGAISGLLGSTVMMIWISIGAQINKPYRESLSRSISGCSNATLDELVQKLLKQTNSTMLPEAVTNPTLVDISYIYKLSYKFYGLAAILLVFIIAIPVSLITSITKSLVLSQSDKPLIWSGWWSIFKLLPSSLRRRYNLNAPKDVKIDSFDTTESRFEGPTKF